MGYIREQFAEKLDVSVSYLAEVERGMTGISVKTLMRICDVLDLSADYVLFGDPRPGDDHFLNKLHRVDEKYLPLVDSMLTSLIEIEK